MKRKQHSSGAFSLVEVVIAIGIFSVVIFGVMGLIPSGMKMFRDSNEQSGGANLLNALSDSIRRAVTTDGTNYTWSYSGSSYAYTINGSAVSNNLNTLTLQGCPATNTLDQQLKAVVVVTPPSTVWSEGSAMISVAWPASGGAAWNAASQQWSHADGSATLGIRFIPLPPGS